jgi:acetyl esterase
MQGLLDMLAAADSPPMSEVSLEDARAAYLTMHAMTDRPARELAVIEDLSCPGPAGDIPIRLYDARDIREAGPAIVFFHGGGFVIGDLATHNALCTEIAAQMDLPVIAVDYRLAPEHPFPAATDDCEAAARWVATSPEALGREITGLVTVGDSAGGNASIVVCQALAANAADVPCVLQVPIFPLASDAATSNSIQLFADGYVLTRDAIEFFESHYKPDKSDPRAIPTLGAHQGTPPSIIVTASLDPIRDSGRDYAAALSEAGVDHMYIEMQGVTHSFTNLRQAVPSTQADLERIFEAMKFMLNLHSGNEID